jgi:hypothetical protein
MRAEDFRESVALWTDDVRKKVLDDKVRGGAILDRWFELDPVSAKAFAKALYTPVTGEPSTVIAAMDIRETVAASAARSDPKWALENLLQETDFPHFANPSGSIIFEVAKQDEALAKEWIKRTEGSKQHGLLMPGYVRGIAKRDPVEALEIAMAEKGFERLNLIPMAVEAAASQSRGVLMETLAKIDDPSLRRSAAVGAFRVLAQETNADFFQFLDDAIGRDNLGELKRRAFAFNDVVEANPSGTANWAASLPPEHRSDVMSQVLERWKEIDPQAAKEWIESQNASSPATGTSEQALADLGRFWMASELLDAGKPQEAISALSDIRNGGLMVGNLAWQLTLEDPVATGRLALNLPECQARETVAGTVAAYWTTRDPSAAAKWVEQLPSGPSRDAALLTMISAAVEQNPESTSHWVNLYNDPQRQIISIRQIYGQWTAEDPEAARKWIKSLSCVDERWRTKFLRQNP